MAAILNKCMELLLLSPFGKSKHQIKTHQHTVPQRSEKDYIYIVNVFLAPCLTDVPLCLTAHTSVCSITF